MGPAISMPPNHEADERERLRTKQFQLVAVCLALAIASLMLRLVYMRRLETTSVLFIGVPTVLSVLLALTPRARSVMGMVMKGITLGLLMSAILFGEGVVCILMAAPLCYLVGALVAIAVRRLKTRQALGIALLPLGVMSLEGTSDRASFGRDETVSIRRVLAASPADVEAALSVPIRFRTDLPTFFKIGFPRPVEARGHGLSVGDPRFVRFAENGGTSGELILLVTAREPSAVRFGILEDRSMVGHWLAWREATVSWHPVDEAHTAVVWTLQYRRGLDPAWYFGPIQRYVVGLAAGYLIDNLAIP